MKKTREMRRAEKTFHAAKARKFSWDDTLEDDIEGCKELLLSKGVDPRNVKHFYKNGVISITVFEYPGGHTLLGFRQNTQDKDIPWRVKHVLKAAIGYGDRWGFEAFPPEDQLVDAANMYWVILPGENATLYDLNFRTYRLYPKLHGEKNDRIDIR